ncbi:hypothetical protein T07_14261 [Trichinella nelsoni]|uniref:Uncharacterized protein n=1 Tax=Trichinella nelsoni TaxID=6336 RepID=A0A0V0RCG2_9BILA|nr:hypothetical protein T07_14261 [Trichinella nelsoni]
MEVVHIVFDHNGLESVSCHRCSSIVGSSISAFLKWYYKWCCRSPPAVQIVL